MQTSGDYEWGLALDLSEPWPSPGNYSEPADEIVYWDRARPDIVERMGQVCFSDDEYPKDGVPELHSILFTPYMFCSAGLGEIRAMQAEIEKAGNHSALEVLRDSATQRMQDLRARLSEMVYADVSSVQVVALLMAAYVSNNEVWSRSEEQIAECNVNCTGDLLFGLLMNFDSIDEAARAIDAVADFLVEDRSHQCHPPHLDLHKEITERFGRVVEDHRPSRDVTTLLEAPGNPDVASREYAIANMHATVERVQLGRAEIAADYGWWPLQLGILSNLGFYEAFFRYADGDRLPSFDEARFLHAVALSEPRSIWTDHAISVRFDPERTSGTFWGSSAVPAIAVLAIEGIEWRFAEVTCSQEQAL